MAQYSLSRNSKNRPRKNDDLYEVMMFAHSDGNFVTTVNPFGKQVVSVDDDTVQHTSKNRRKVSTYEISDFGTFNVSKSSNIWEEAIVGTASATLDPYLGMVKLEVGSNAGDSIIRETNRVQGYIPGRQSEVSMSKILGAGVAGVRKRFGVFNNNSGAYFEQNGDEYYCVLRRNTAGGVVEERVGREDWNGDKLDGTGPSGILADPSKIQLLVIEYEWYGAGEVQFKYVINNNSYAVHTIYTANRFDYSWSSTGSLPVRIELTNVDGVPGPHVYYQGSHSFLTEGSTSILGRQTSVSTAITGNSFTNANTFYPLVAIRLKSDHLNSVVIPDEYAGATLDNTGLFVKVLYDVALTGGTWISQDSDSPVEYNITATSFTGGEVISTNFISANNMGVLNSFAERSITQLKRNTTTTLNDTASIFLVAGATIGSNKDGWGSIGWIEVR